MSETLQVPTRRGITQRDVWLAVDAVVGQGRRPTIDAVRQQLGRGSPNTIQAHLDSWFAHLGERLGDGGEPVASPLPPFLTAAASHLWEAAHSAAREVAAGELHDQRELLDRQISDLEAREGAFRQHELAAAARVEAAQASARQAAEERSAADRREALANERAARLEAQIAQLTAELERGAADLRDARQQLRLERLTTTEERAKLLARMEGQDRHWFAEVERARGEATAASSAQAAAEKRHIDESAALSAKILALQDEARHYRDLAKTADAKKAQAAAEAEGLRRALVSKLSSPKDARSARKLVQGKRRFRA